MTVYRLRVASGFLLGAIAMLVIERRWAFAIFGVASLPVTGFVGGAIGGASLMRGWRPVAGFGCGSALLAVVLFLTLMPIQTMTGKENAVLILLFYTIAWGAGSGVAGAIGTAFMGRGRAFALAGARSFAVAGAVGGAIAGLCLNGALHGSSIVGMRGAVLLLAGVGASGVLPFALGGWLFASAARAWEQSVSS